MFFSLPQKSAVLIWPGFFFPCYPKLSQICWYISRYQITVHFFLGYFRGKEFQTSVRVKFDLKSPTMSSMFGFFYLLFSNRRVFLCNFCQLKTDMFLYIKGLSCNSSKLEMHKTKNCTSLKSDPNWKGHPWLHVFWARTVKTTFLKFYISIGAQVWIKCNILDHIWNCCVICPGLVNAL